MAISQIVKTLRDSTLTITDGTRTCVIAFEEGTLQLDIPGPTINHFPDRGEISTTAPSLRKGDDQPMSGSFTCYCRDISDAAYITTEEILTNSGYYASTWVSTLGASAEVKTVTLQWDIEGTAHGDSADHQIVCKFCVPSGSLAEGHPTVVTFNFTSWDQFPDVV
jgi:hypothetical protein